MAYIHIHDFLVFCSSYQKKTTHTYTSFLLSKTSSFFKADKQDNTHSFDQYADPTAIAADLGTDNGAEPRHNVCQVLGIGVGLGFSA